MVGAGQMRDIETGYGEQGRAVGLPAVAGTFVSGAVLGWLGLLIPGTAAAGPDWPRRCIAPTLGLESGLDLGKLPPVFQFGINEATAGLAVVSALAFGVLIRRSRNLEAGVVIALWGVSSLRRIPAIYDLPLLLVALPTLPPRVKPAGCGLPYSRRFAVGHC